MQSARLAAASLHRWQTHARLSARAYRGRTMLPMFFGFAASCAHQVSRKVARLGTKKPVWRQQTCCAKQHYARRTLLSVCRLWPRHRSVFPLPGVPKFSRRAAPVSDLHHRARQCAGAAPPLQTVAAQPAGKRGNHCRGHVAAERGVIPQQQTRAWWFHGSSPLARSPQAPAKILAPSQQFHTISFTALI